MADDDTGAAAPDTGAELAKLRERVASLSAALREVKAERDTLTARVTELEPLAGRVEAAEAAAAEAARKADTSITLARAGVVDPDAADLVLHRYGRLPEDGRPELSAWLAEAARADALLAGVWGTPPTTAPEAAAPPAGTAAPPTTAPPAPRPNAAATQAPPPGPPPLTASSIAAMTPEQYRAQRDQIRALLAKG